jgi:RNA polymerase sigma-70 factor (ECF subfamily)
VETEDLLRRARDGDEPAVAELLVRHRDRLRRMIAARMDPRVAARLDPSDVLQEALLEASRRLPEYLERRGCAFYPWLRQIAWERLVQLHRRHIEAQRRTVKREARRGMTLSDASSMALAERLAASGTSPSGRLLRKELHQRVRGALDVLAPPDREIILLRHVEQLSHKEIADVLRISPGAARTRYCRAVERLHDLLSDESGTV